MCSIDDPRYEVVEDQQEEGFRNILVIHDADNTDFGDYNCSVVNEYGIARKLIRLNKESKYIFILFTCLLIEKESNYKTFFYFIFKIQVY